MKNILVTGADGFIGSHLTELLVSIGYEVTALAQYNSFNNWGWLEHVDCKDNMEIVSGDIRDPYFCKTLCENKDAVFHLAALIAIPYSYTAPNSYIETNIHGTLNMCQAAVNAGVEKFIHTSTSEVYGTARYVPIDEAHPIQAQSPYSASKIGADAVAMSHHYSYELPVTIARPFNTYGPRQSARAIIPTIISQILSGKNEISIGDTRPTRDFNYVLDTCRGLMAIFDAVNTNGEVINIGSNKEITIGELAMLIKNLLDKDITFVTDENRIRPEKSEVLRLCCDNSKIRKLTSFVPGTSLREGLSLTIEWMKKPETLKFYKSEIYNV